VSLRKRRRRAAGVGSVGEVARGAVAVGLYPERIAAAGEEPGDGGVVALRDAADVEHVGRAIGARIAAVGAEPDAPPALVELLAMAGAEAGEALAGPGVPIGAGAEPEASGGEVEDEALGMELELQPAKLGLERDRT
jgi:hypothetical protein